MSWFLILADALIRSMIVLVPCLSIRHFLGLDLIVDNSSLTWYHTGISLLRWDGTLTTARFMLWVFAAFNKCLISLFSQVRCGPLDGTF